MKVRGGKTPASTPSAPPGRFGPKHTRFGRLPKPRIPTMRAASADSAPIRPRPNAARNRKTKPIIAAERAMTSFRQIDANRRNASKSTGPTTEEGKRRSRRNAVRHGLTAETVIGALEDAEDYRAFEAAIIADYDAHLTVERELVLRLASLLWRLRRATTMETGLFEIQADYAREFRRHTQANTQEIIYTKLGWADSVDADPDRASHDIASGEEAGPNIAPKSVDAWKPTSRIAFCVWPICPVARLTGLAVMKQSFGARPLRSYLRLMH